MFDFSILIIALLALVILVGIIALVVVLVSKSKTAPAQPTEDRSYFDGGYFAYLGCNFLVGFVSAITLGIAFPWMCCWLQRWKAKHTVICGKRMYFDGTGLQLIGKYLLWSFLTIITFGIYGLWMSVAMKKWICSHTHFVGEEDNNSYFDGGVGGFLGTNILSTLVLLVPFVGGAWSTLIKLRWYTKHTVTDSRRLVFVGTLGNFFLKYLLWGFLTGITFGIFALFLPVKNLRLETENTIDHEHTPEALMQQSEYRNIIRTDGASFKTCRVEDEMEGVKAGILDTTPQEELLALANSGSRAAQYLYVTRYADEQYTAEPFSSLLKSSAQAEYAPAMSLYALTHDTDTAAELLTKAAEKGQIPALRNRLVFNANLGFSSGYTDAALPCLKTAVRYADLLKEADEILSEEEEALAKKATLAIRRIECKLPKGSGGKVALAVVGILVGIPLVLGVIGGGAALLLRWPLLESRPAQSVSATTEQFWEEYQSKLAAEYHESTLIDSYADDDSLAAYQAYKVTNDHYYYSSEFKVTVYSDNRGRLESIQIEGSRNFDKRYPNDGLNEQEIVFAIRTAYATLGLGEFEDIQPVTANGSTEITYGNWTFFYNNSKKTICVTIQKNSSGNNQNDMVAVAPARS